MKKSPGDHKGTGDLEPAGAGISIIKNEDTGQ